jgi:UDP-2,4-diacetamido-2,4,6-trideoxy-beta-L-altropyranose hydrolase
MTLLLRADAGTRSGTGHVMRLLALAQAWQDAGGRAVFAASEMTPAVEARLARERLSLEHVASDAYDTIRLARAHNASWIAVDGYHFDAAYQRTLKEAGFSVLWIDDDAHAEEYCADLILNQNLHADAAMYAQRKAEAHLLLGPRFALLRREFRTWNGVRGAGDRVLVTLGGSDPENVTLRVIGALRELSVEATVVVGGSNASAEAIANAARGTDRIRIERDVDDMPRVLAQARLAVSAGGTTCWELAFFGVPILAIVVADNQRPLTAGLQRAGVAIDLGWHCEVTHERLASALSSLLANDALRSRMSQRGRELVDGQGAPRVVGQMLGGGLHLRAASSDDCRRVWEWANDPDVREASFSRGAIAWEEHLAWFAKNMNRTYIAMHGEQPIGVIRYDRDGDAATVSISVDRAARGRGRGTSMIRLGTQRLFAESGVEIIHAYVRPENASSIKAFQNAGFERIDNTVVRGVDAVHLIKRRRAPA